MALPLRARDIINFGVLAVSVGRTQSSLSRQAESCWRFLKLLAEHQPETGLRFMTEAFLSGIDTATIRQYVAWKAKHAEKLGAI